MRREKVQTTLGSSVKWLDMSGPLSQLRYMPENGPFMRCSGVKIKWCPAQCPVHCDQFLLLQCVELFPCLQHYSPPTLAMCYSCSVYCSWRRNW